jgi:hypothetical protein
MPAIESGISLERRELDTALRNLILVSQARQKRPPKGTIRELFLEPLTYGRHGVNLMRTNCKRPSMVRNCDASIARTASNSTYSQTC